MACQTNDANAKTAGLIRMDFDEPEQNPLFAAILCNDPKRDGSSSMSATACKVVRTVDFHPPLRDHFQQISRGNVKVKRPAASA